MASASAKKEKIELLDELVNDVLKEELKTMANTMKTYNAEVHEYAELRNTIEALKTNFPDGNFKTHMAIGHQMFMEAKVPDTKNILVDIGLGISVDFTLEEALNFCDFKIKFLKKEVDVHREMSLTNRMQIKQVLMYIGEVEKLYGNTTERED